MTPGSDAARALGCTCAEIENNGGTGTRPSCPDAMHGPQFLVSSNCLMHGSVAWDRAYLAANPPSRSNDWQDERAPFGLRATVIECRSSSTITFGERKESNR